jgi:hypothetical protein
VFCCAWQASSASEEVRSVNGGDGDAELEWRLDNSLDRGLAPCLQTLIWDMGDWIFAAETAGLLKYNVVRGSRRFWMLRPRSQVADGRILIKTDIFPNQASLYLRTLSAKGVVII